MRSGGLSRTAQQKPPGGTCAACPPPRSGVPLPPLTSEPLVTVTPQQPRAGCRQGGGFSQPGCRSLIAHLLVSGAGGGVRPPPSAPSPSQRVVGETRAAPSLAGWGLEPEERRSS